MHLCYGSVRSSFTHDSTICITTSVSITQNTEWNVHDVLWTVHCSAHCANQLRVTTLQTEKSPRLSLTFLDEIAGNMSNKCTCMSCHNQISMTTQIPWPFPDISMTSGPFSWLFTYLGRIPWHFQVSRNSKKVVTLSVACRTRGPPRGNETTVFQCHPFPVKLDRQMALLHDRSFFFFTHLRLTQLKIKKNTGLQVESKR